jgi:hypothetical protein
MSFPDYLERIELKAKVDYEWTRRIGNSFQAVPGEDYPKLWDALDEISVRAAFALGVACCEWTVARLSHLIHTADAVLRIEAARAATIDFRCASLPKPVTPKTPSGPDPIAEPLWLAQLFLTYLQDFYNKTYNGVANKGVRGSTLRLVLLAKHVVPKKAGFDKWLTASLKKAKQHYPAKKMPVQQEAPVPPDFFCPDFRWTAQAVAESQAGLLAILDPSRNPYLREAEDES